MTLRARLAGLTATVALLGLLAGLPATLLALGANPIPRALPTLEAVRHALTTPDDGTLALAAITVIAWAAWLVLAGAILVEIGSRLRGVRPPHLPGLHLPQIAARHLVTTAALLFIAAPTTAIPGTATPAHAATAATTAGTTAGTSAPAGAAALTYTVRPGDTLSQIAHHHLGDPNRWPEIAALNPAVAEHPDLIYAGTTLHLPAPPRVPARAHTYTVTAGDTLSAIARRELGDATKYPAIFEASKNTLQPGGTHLTDPDHIDVGQTLTIPGAGPTLTPAPRASTPPPAAPAPTPATRPRPGHRPDLDEPAPTPAAPTPATPAAGPVPAGATQRHTTTGDTDQDDHLTAAPWMLTGLTGAGALLAGSALMLLRRRRRAQSRHRRPGRTLAPPEPALAPVEKTITAVGTATAPTVEHLDTILRRLAATSAADASPMPHLAAVELTATDLVLHLSDPAGLPHPWAGTPDGYHWTIPADAYPDTIGPDVPDQPAPYPLLVTIGVSDTDDVWLLNLEDLTVTITGDPTYGHDFARYVAAEVACNPWSASVHVACLGVATEVAPLNPDRVHAYPAHHDDADPISEYLADAVATIDAADDADQDVATARAHQTGADTWPARLLLIDAPTDHAALDQLLDLIHTHPGHTATSVVIRGHHPQSPGTLIDVTADGRVTLPDAGLNLIAVGLTSDEAHGCAALLAHSDTLTNAPIPVDQAATNGWRSYADQAGALRAEHTLPRTPPPPTPPATPVTTPPPPPTPCSTATTPPTPPSPPPPVTT